MRTLLLVTVAVAAVLAPAAPASSGASPGDLLGPPAPAPVERVRARPPLPLDPPPHEGCTVPVSDTLEPCPPDGSPRPPLSCVLPVGLDREPVVPPDCPHPRPAPEGRVLPLSR